MKLQLNQEPSKSGVSLGTKCFMGVVSVLLLCILISLIPDTSDPGLPIKMPASLVETPRQKAERMAQQRRAADERQRIELGKNQFAAPATESSTKAAQAKNAAQRKRELEQDRIYAREQEKRALSRAQKVAKYLKSGFGTPGAEAYWYPFIQRVTARGSTVIAHLDVEKSEEFDQIALRVCETINGYVNSSNNTDKFDSVEIESISGRPMAGRSMLNGACGIY